MALTKKKQNKRKCAKKKGVVVYKKRFLSGIMRSD